MKPKVIEVVLFKSKPEISAEELTKAAASVESFAQTQAGYLKRELGVNEDGLWMDIVYWTDLESAHEAAQAAMESPICQPFFGMIDEAQMTMHHFNIALS